MSPTISDVPDFYTVDRYSAGYAIFKISTQYVHPFKSYDNLKFVRFHCISEATPTYELLTPVLKNAITFEVFIIER